MLSVARQNRPSEETFRMQVWSLLPHLQVCLWSGKSLAESAVEYSKLIRTALEKMEKQIEEETAKGLNKY